MAEDPCLFILKGAKLLSTKGLSHLSSEEIKNLMQRYYNGEAVAKLKEEYNISGPISGVYKLFPPEIHPDYSCEYCNEFLVSNRPSKTMKSFPLRERDLYCPICGHKPFEIQCKCKNCLKKEQTLRFTQLKQIKETYSKTLIPVDFWDLSFEDKVFLGALCRALLKENMYDIEPYWGSEAVLAPTNVLCKKLYVNLIHSQAIAVSPQSPLEAFNTDREDFPHTFFVYKVFYSLNLEFLPNKQDLFSEIMNPDYYSAEFANDALALWKEIAVAECIEYLQYQLDRVNFAFVPGDKTYKTFELILEDFSVSQIYGIIWRAVADASKLYLEKGMSRKHAANSVIGACKRYSERAKLNGWELTHYNRIRDLPQSELSLFFFNRVLGIGEMGFKIPPTIV